MASVAARPLINMVEPMSPALPMAKVSPTAMPENSWMELLSASTIEPM